MDMQTDVLPDLLAAITVNPMLADANCYLVVLSDGKHDMVLADCGNEEAANITRAELIRLLMNVLDKR